MALFHLPQAVRVNSTGTPYAGAKAHFHLTGTTTDTDTYTDSALSVAHANPVVADAAGQFAPIYLDPAITYRCIIKDSADATLDDVDPVSAPLASSSVSVLDTAGKFAGTDVETVLADLGTNYPKFNAENTFSADQTFSADLKMADNLIERPEIKDFGVTHNAITQSPSGTLTLDFSTGNSFYHLLTANVTTVTILNPPATGTFGQITILFQQDSAGGAYTVTWPAAVLFPGGTDIVISTANDSVDQVTLTTINAGTTYLANFSQAYA